MQPVSRYNDVGLGHQRPGVSNRVHRIQRSANHLQLGVVDDPDLSTLASPRTHWSSCPLLLVPVLPPLHPASRRRQTTRQVIILPANPLRPLPLFSARNKIRDAKWLLRIGDTNQSIYPCSSRRMTGGRLPRPMSRRRERQPFAGGSERTSFLQADLD